MSTQTFQITSDLYLILVTQDDTQNAYVIAQHSGSKLWGSYTNDGYLLGTYYKVNIAFAYSATVSDATTQVMAYDANPQREHIVLSPYRVQTVT
jgi:hypothetical protein